MKFDVTADLKEGMTIMPIEAYRRKETSPSYRLVKSSEDGELYGYFRSDVLRVSEIVHDDYIVTDLSSLEETDSYLEIKLPEEKTKLIENDSGSFDEIKEIIEEKCYSYDEFVDIDMRVISLTREEFLLKTQGKDIPEFSLRKKIKAFYDNAIEVIDTGIKRVSE